MTTAERAFFSACAEAHRMKAQQYHAEARAARLNPYRTPGQREAMATHYESLAAQCLDLAAESEGV